MPEDKLPPGVTYVTDRNWWSAPDKTKPPGRQFPAASHPTNSQTDQENTIMTPNPDAMPDEPFEPVNLDPRSPALTRWDELVEVSPVIDHDGDVSKLMQITRPEWSDPDCDQAGANLGHCYYSSDYADVPVVYRNGQNHSDHIVRASYRVRARIDGLGLALVGVHFREWISGKWHKTEGVSLSPTEARQLAAVLIAAADLHGEA